MKRVSRTYVNVEDVLMKLPIKSNLRDGLLIMFKCPGIGVFEQSNKIIIRL